MSEVPLYATPPEAVSEQDLGIGHVHWPRERERERERARKRERERERERESERARTSERERCGGCVRTLSAPRGREFTSQKCEAVPRRARI